MGEAQEKPDETKPDLPVVRRESKYILEEEAHFHGEGFRVVLFNDDDHSLKDVVEQLMKALRCAQDEANAITLAAHRFGHALVTITTREEAEAISLVLREIDLKVEVKKI